MRKRISVLIAALMLALTMSVASVAFAANPHAGGSGHFKGSAKQCKDREGHPKCPPLGS
jgi:hypothetical protein